MGVCPNCELREWEQKGGKDWSVMRGKNQGILVASKNLLDVKSPCGDVVGGGKRAKTKAQGW